MKHNKRIGKKNSPIIHIQILTIFIDKQLYWGIFNMYILRVQFDDLTCTCQWSHHHNSPSTYPSPKTLHLPLNNLSSLPSTSPTLIFWQLQISFPFVFTFFHAVSIYQGLIPLCCCVLLVSSTATWPFTSWWTFVFPFIEWLCPAIILWYRYNYYPHFRDEDMEA